MTIVYVLQLTSNKYYIGKTDKNMQARFQEHLDGIGSEFTSKYKPTTIVEIVPNTDDFDEDKYTKKYMAQYGIDNVRDGSYTSATLHDYQKKALQTELLTSKNKCFNCEETGHFVNNCPTKNNKRSELTKQFVKTNETNMNMIDSIYKLLLGLDKRIINIEQRLMNLENKSKTEPEIYKEKSESSTTIFLTDKLLKWCNETTKDHHTLYLLDKMKNNYYYITNSKLQYGPHQLSQPIYFENHNEMFWKKAGYFDLIYHDDNYKIIICTPNGIKQDKRTEISLSIQTMINKGEFIYCNF